MLRISTDTTKEGTRIKVEGKLAGPLVLELERAWQEVRFARPIVIDLCGVTYIDGAGKRLLRTVCDEGASFLSCGPDITATIAEIKQCSDSANRDSRCAPA